MMKLATLIVDKRKGFYLIFIVLCIFCVLSMNKVKVNNDLTTYLPDTTETRRGLDLMDSEFTTYSFRRILICNVTFDEAQKLADQVEKMDGVSMLDFDDTEDHYHDMEALLSVTFDEEADTEATQQHLTEVLDALSDYDVYYSSDIGQEERDADDLNNDMIVILLLAAVVIVAVLLFTSTTYAEIPVYLTTFIVAAILNKGTNYWFGTISFVTNSIAVVLQLGLAVDYAIILAHRFMEEHEDKDAREAVIVALSKAIPRFLPAPDHDLRYGSHDVHAVQNWLRYGYYPGEIHYFQYGSSIFPDADCCLPFPRQLTTRIIRVLYRRSQQWENSVWLPATLYRRF